MGRSLRSDKIDPIVGINRQGLPSSVGMLLRYVRGSLVDSSISALLAFYLVLYPRLIIELNAESHLITHQDNLPPESSGQRKFSARPNTSKTPRPTPLGKGFLCLIYLLNKETTIQSRRDSCVIFTSDSWGHIISC